MNGVGSLRIMDLDMFKVFHIVSGFGKVNYIICYIFEYIAHKLLWYNWHMVVISLAGFI